MGIECVYRRITPERFAQLMVRPEAPLYLHYAYFDAYFFQAYYGVLDEPDQLLVRMEEAEVTGQVFNFGTDWHAVNFLLTDDTSCDGAGPILPPLGNLVFGGTPTPFKNHYGSIRFLTPEEVRAVADALREIDVVELRQRFDPVAFSVAGIWPLGKWDEHHLDALLEGFLELVEFWSRAAAARDMVLLSFD